MKKLAFLIILLISITSFSNTDISKKPIIVFDFHGVLFDRDFSNVYELVSTKFHLSMYQTKKLIKNYKRLAATDAAEKMFWKRMAQYTNIHIDDNWLEKFSTVNAQSYIPVEGMQNLVTQLKQQNYQVAILSNAKANNAKLIRSLGYQKPFCPVLFSFEIGACKPHSKAYHILLKHLKQPASRCIFIDDKLKNIRAAQSLGFDGILFISKDQLVTELKKRSIDL